jgi:hypothetical protein
MPLSEDQHPVGEFGWEGQDKGFGEAVRPRQRGGILTTADTRFCLPAPGQRRTELTGPSADEEP